jgi:hypothetical protein
MTVSNEDREAAIVELSKHYSNVNDQTNPGLVRCVCGAEFEGWHKHIADVLVSHGWGPKPKVDSQRLNDAITMCTLDMTVNPLAEYLEQNGVEVTYD